MQKSLVQNKVIKPCWSLNLIYRILHLLLWPNLFILQPTSTCLFYLFTSASDVPCPCSSPASTQVFPFTPFFIVLSEPSWVWNSLTKAWLHLSITLVHSRPWPHFPSFAQLLQDSGRNYLAVCFSSLPSRALHHQLKKTLK